MKYRIKARYPASSEVVLRMLTDPAYYPAKFRLMDQPKLEVLSQSGPPDFRIKLKRQVPLQTAIPGLLRKLLPTETTIVHEDRWDTSRRSGSMQLQVQGVPVELSCTIAVVDDKGDCILDYDWKIHAKVPLLGGALEKFLAADMEQTARKDNEAGIALLKNYR
jgi:hypothetical protein